MKFDYFYGEQSDMYAFYRIPKILITSDYFTELSTNAKLLYGLLLDRVSLSSTNGWFDEQGRVYIIYTIGSIQRDMHCGDKKATRLLAELEKWELIEKKHQGQGVSSIPLADEGMKDFLKIARKYGVDFAIVKDKNQDPPIYTVFFKAKDMDAITRILQDYSAKQVKKDSVEKTSVLEKLKKFKEIVAAIPKKVVEKKKEKVR